MASNSECISELYLTKINAWIERQVAIELIEDLVKDVPNCPASTPCIAASYKAELKAVASARDRNTGQPHPSSVLKPLVSLWDVCGKGGGTSTSTTTRKKGKTWGVETVYINEKGEPKTFVDKDGDPLSVSALYTQLTGKKVSGTIDACGVKGCYCGTVVDNYNLDNYIVRGNGEDPPTRPVPLGGVGRGQGKLTTAQREDYVRRTNEWKDHLKATGKKFIVIHPDAPNAKSAAARVQNTPIENIPQQVATTKATAENENPTPTAEDMM